MCSGSSQAEGMNDTGRLKTAFYRAAPGSQCQNSSTSKPTIMLVRPTNRS